MTATLSDVLLATKMTGMDCAVIALANDSALHFPHTRRASFHFVLEGNGSIVLGGTEKIIKVGQGDFLLLIRGIAHSLRMPGAGEAQFFRHFRAEHEFDIPPVMRFGAEPGLRVLSGVFGMDQSFDGNVDRLIPDLILLESKDGPLGPVFPTGGVPAAFEKACIGPGAKAFIAAFVLLYYVHIVRQNLPRLAVSQSADIQILGLPKIATALRLVEQEPAKAWTIVSLAREVGLSRSVFAEKFSAAVGDSPLHYIRHVRMDKAAELLHQGVSVSEAAQLVGYQSAPAFARAYRRHFGHAPRETGVDGKRASNG